jgi:hypothetical protein
VARYGLGRNSSFQRVFGLEQEIKRPDLNRSKENTVLGLLNPVDESDTVLANVGTIHQTERHILEDAAAPL